MISPSLKSDVISALGTGSGEGEASRGTASVLVKVKHGQAIRSESGTHLVADEAAAKVVGIGVA